MHKLYLVLLLILLFILPVNAENKVTTANFPGILDYASKAEKENNRLLTNNELKITVLFGLMPFLSDSKTVKDTGIFNIIYHTSVFFSCKNYIGPYTRSLDYYNALPATQNEQEKQLQTLEKLKSYKDEIKSMRTMDSILSFVFSGIYLSNASNKSRPFDERQTNLYLGYGYLGMGLFNLFFETYPQENIFENYILKINLD